MKAVLRPFSSSMRFLALIFISGIISFQGFGHDIVSKSNIHRPFVENNGQWDSEIKFRMEIPNGFVFFRDDGITYFFHEELPSIGHSHPVPTRSNLRTYNSNHDINCHSVKLEYRNCDSANAKIQGINGGQEYFNYFLGKDPEKWTSKVKSYAEVFYKNIYPGISIKFYLESSNLKYDILVAPNADLSQLLFEINGQDQLLKEGDNLLIQTSLQNITEQKPFSYQEINNTKNEVPSLFKLNENKISFDFPEGYDKSKELVIDPKLVFSTFSGVTADNWGFTASFDSKGNTYSGGIASVQFGGSIVPAVGSFQQTFGGGNWDMAIFKYDSTGSKLLYGTYLGGNDTDVPHSLVANSKDELLIFGTTGSNDYPTSENAMSRIFKGGSSIIPILGIPYANGSDIVVTRISEDGTEILSSTYLGGTGNDGLSSLIEFSDPLIKNYGDQVRGDIITDLEGNVYVATSTMSVDFELTNSLFASFSGGIRDAVVLKLNSDLSQMEWGTYVGGSGEDAAFSVKLDANNNVLIAGATNSADLPVGVDGFISTFNGGIDGFVNYFDKDGSNLISGTFVGTPQDDLVYFSDFDSEGNVYLLGQSDGDYPITSGIYSNPNSQQFIHKLSSDLSTSIFSTQFGSGQGRQDISTTAFLVNECDNLFVAGWGSSGPNFGVSAGYNGMNTSGLPITQNGFQTETSGNDFYLAVFNANMENLLYATFMGGTTAAPHVDGGTSRFDKRGVVYQSVCSCGGASDNFPTTEEAWSTTNNAFPLINGNGGSFPRCNNVVFKFDLATILAGIETNTPEGDSPGISKVCLPEPILFTNVSIGGEQVEWDFGDGTTIANKDSVVHIYKSAGKYNVILRIEDQNTCKSVDFGYAKVEVFGHDISIMDDTSICQGDVVQLNAIGAAAYNWTLADKSTPLDGFNPLIKPEESTQYFLIATTSNGCTAEDSVYVEVIPSHQLAFNIKKQLPCSELPSFQFSNTSTINEGLVWDFGDGSAISQGDTVIHQYGSPGRYSAKLTLENPNSCTEISSIETVIEVFKSDIQVMEDPTICKGFELTLSATGGSAYEWKPFGQTNWLEGEPPSVRPQENTIYILNTTDLNGCISSDSVNVQVLNSYALDFEIEKEYSCSGLPLLKLINKSNIEEGLTWNFGDGQSEEGLEVSHFYDGAGSYTIELSYDPEICSPPKTQTVDLEELFIPNAFSPNNDTFNEYFKIEGPSKMALSVVNRLGNEVFKSENYNNDWDASGVPAGIYYYVLNLSEESQCNGWVQVFK